MTFTSQLEVCKSAARAAGELIVQARESGTRNQFKDHQELVTSADVEADRLIADAIMQAFPGHRLISEELSPHLVHGEFGNSPCWIVDPIDGTVNFAHGHNQSAVSIAYAEGGDIAAAVVFNPFTDEMFWATRGGGSWRNGTPIRVAAACELSRAIIATGFPYRKDGLEILLRRLRAVLYRCADVRRLGAASLDICWVAMGRLDGYYENLSLWDFAAAQLIAREAGARYGHFQPVPRGISPVFHDQNILVANPVLYPLLETLLQQADAAPD